MSGRAGLPRLALAAPRWRPAAGSPRGIAGLLGELVDAGQVSAAVAVVARSVGAARFAAAGDAATARQERAPLFDLASLTKPWTASLALRLDARGRLPLALELGELWPHCDRRLADRTLEDLLRHRAGLLAWAPLYRRCRSRHTVARRLLDGGLLGARRGTYSDLGYILWGLAAERALGRSLAELLRDELAGPLRLDHRPPPAGPGSWLPCGLDNGREVELAAAQGVRVARRGPPRAGRVQDGNARFLGAPAGHAGLFATAGALVALARAWLRPGRLWSAAAAASALDGPGPWLLGWRRPRRRGSAGPVIGPDAFGHVGFTGGSLWVDPDSDRVLLLLAHRTGVGVDLKAARRRFHVLALAGG